MIEIEKPKALLQLWQLLCSILAGAVRPSRATLYPGKYINGSCLQPYGLIRNISSRTRAEFLLRIPAIRDCPLSIDYENSFRLGAPRE